MTRWKRLWERTYVALCCLFVLWEAVRMTEARFLPGTLVPLGWCWAALAVAALWMRRFRCAPAYLLGGALLWMALVSAYRGAAVLEAEKQALRYGTLAFLVLFPLPFQVERERLRRALTVLLALWTAVFAAQGLLGLWAAFTGHAVFSLQGSWYIGVNLGDHRLYLMAYVTTGAARLGLSVALAAMGAALCRRWPGRIAFLLGAAVEFVCLSLTDGRTVFVALGAALGLCACAVLTRHVRRCNWRRWVAGLLAVPLLTAGTYVAFTRVETALAPQVQEDLVNLTLTELPQYLLPQAEAEENAAVQHRPIDGSNLFHDRELVWQAAVKLLRDNPKLLLMGVSAPLAKIHLNRYVSPEAPRPFDHAHSIFLQTLVCWGIPGLAMLLVLIGWFLCRAARLFFCPNRPLWERLTPVPALYVLLCETVECFTLLWTGSAMLNFALLSMGLTMALSEGRKEHAGCDYPGL